MLRATHPAAPGARWGQARYFDLVTAAKVAQRRRGAIRSPHRVFEPIAGAVAVMAGHVDRCTVNGETVVPQPGGFYGGWITSWVVGPFIAAPARSGGDGPSATGNMPGNTRAAFLKHRADIPVVDRRRAGSKAVSREGVIIAGY